MLKGLFSSGITKGVAEIETGLHSPGAYQSHQALAYEIQTLARGRGRVAQKFGMGLCTFSLHPCSEGGGAYI